MTDHPILSNPAQFPRMLGTMLAALHHWIEVGKVANSNEQQLMTVGGRFLPLDAQETKALYSFLSGMLSSDFAPASNTGLPRLQHDALRHTRGPLNAVVRGERAYLTFRDSAGTWEVANVNLCMGEQSDANLAVFKNAPDLLNVLLDMLKANELDHPLPWGRAKQVAQAATTPFA